MEEELRVCDPFKVDHTQDITAARIKSMSDELVQGFDFLRQYKLAATFFGSARSVLDPQIYADAKALAGKLAQSGFAVITGGAGGIMEAANRGAFEAGGQSLGLNIRLPQEQGGNGFTTAHTTFNYFFTRRVMLAFASEVYVFFPGGYGTLDEFFEILTLVQTGKIKRIPIIIYGKAFWAPLVSYIEKVLLEENKTINKDDLDLFVLVDSVDEAYEQILKSVKC